MPKIWLDTLPHRSGLAVLEGQAELLGPAIDPDPANPLARLEEADAVLCSALFPGTGETFDRAERLRVVARMGIGYDNVDCDAATVRGICVVNTPDAPTEATAEFAVTLMLAVARHLVPAHIALNGGTWNPQATYLGFELAGKTLGLVGLGRIGGRVAELARAFRMDVVAFDPYISPDRAAALGVRLAPDLPSVLGAVDVVSLHIPASAQTRRFIGARELAMMKKGAILINVARGAILDESALADALRSGHLAGAGIDVWDPEPTYPENPLLKMPNVVATPHIAGATHEGRVRGHPMAASQVLMVLRGERPPHLVNPEVWDRRRPL